MSYNSCARAADIEMNVLLPFSKFIRSLSKSYFGVDLKKKKNPNPKIQDSSKPTLPLYPLFAPADVIIYSERISVEQSRLY